MNRQNGKGKNKVYKKIAVLTFHRCINYGSFWQASCLVEWLRARGCEAVILDHNSRRVNLAEWKCAFRPILPTFVPKTDFPLYRAKIEKFFRAFDSLPLSAQFPLENPWEMESFDSVIVGSDEVWNLCHPWYGGCPLFFGEGLQTKHLISYAASFGNYDASAGLNEDWKNQLRNFDFISVRDENSRSLIKNMLGFDPEMVLDPCLLFSPQPEERNPQKTESPFIAVYGHNFSETFIWEIQNYAESRNYKLISIGYRNDWADEQWITADPHDFAHFINRAEAVATNFFHGCVFALLNSKPFACEATSYRSNKIRDLMKLLAAEKQIVSGGGSAEFNMALSEPLKPDIQRKINYFRQMSENYLENSLKLNDA